MPLSIQTTGVKVKIKRTMTPAKYTALREYKMTEKENANTLGIIIIDTNFENSLNLINTILPKTLSSLTFFMQYHNPTGNVVSNI